MSPKNKGTHGRGKAVAHEPDEFVQRVNTLGDRIQPHIMKIVAFAGLLLVGLIVWKVLDWRHEKKAASATQSYAEAVRVASASVGEDDPSGDGDSLSFPTVEAQAQAALSAFSSVQSGHGDMDLSKVAAVQEAQLLLKSGKFDAALKKFNKAARSSLPQTLKLLAMEGRGYALEGKALALEDADARQAALEQALSAFAELQPNKDGSMRDYSLLHQGRLLLALGRADEGTQKLKELVDSFPNSPATPAAETRLESIETDAE